MDIIQSTVDKITFLRVSGFLDSTTSNQLQSVTTACLDVGEVLLVIDFADVGYISSAGLRVILMTAKRAHAGNGKLVVCGLSNPVRETFEISGLDRFISISNTAGDALLVVRG